MAFLDYYLWKENNGVADIWMWEVVSVDDDTCEETSKGRGIEQSKEVAMGKIKEVMRSK